MATDYIGGGVSTPAVSSTEPHKTAVELPPPIQQLQPPASNAGSDDPTAGIPEGAGGLSSTAAIGSPVPAESQTVVGSVLEYAFGKRERTAEEVEAAAPTTSSVTSGGQTATGPSSTTVLGAIAGAAAAGGAVVASIIPGMSSTTETEHTPATTEKTLSQQATEATESAKVTASEAVESVQESAQAAGQSTKEAVGQDKSTEETEVDQEKAEKAKQVSDHEAAVRENKESIPTAGGEKLGAAHEGESKVIPPVPPVTTDESGTSSAAGQPDSTTAANTAKNADAGDARKPSTDSKNGEGKPKFFNRLKTKLHIGDKKDKA